MKQVIIDPTDERVPIGDLRALTTIYRKIIDRYFA